jgi:hypothetical protein
MATFYLLIMLRESVGRQHVGSRNKCPVVIKVNTLATKIKYCGVENGPMVNRKATLNIRRSWAQLGRI